MLRQEKRQQPLQWHHLGHRQNIAARLHEIRLIRTHLQHQILNVNQANSVIQMPFAHRKTRVLRAYSSLEVFFEGVLCIEENDLFARRRDVPNHPLAQIQRVNQDLFTYRRYLPRVFAFRENHAQFFLGMRQLMFPYRTEPENFAKK